MGRKANFKDPERPKKGPGRKTKKQKDPEIIPHIKKLIEADEEPKKLSHRQKQRLARRLKKKQEKIAKRKENKQLQKEARLKEKEDKKNTPSINVVKEIEKKTGKKQSLENDTSSKKKKRGFSDENNEWLKPKKAKLNKDDSEEDDEDGSDVEESDEPMSSDDDGENYKMESLNDLDDSDDGEEEDNSDDFSDDSENDDDEDDDSGHESDQGEGEDGSDDELPIEKASKKLKKKQAKEEKLANEELQMNIADHEVFAFPSEEEADKVLSIPDVEQRIKDVLMVLGNFKQYRDPARSRCEYTSLLLKDLCTYFSYNEFLMERIMQIFPLDELMSFLEASETQRPLTIRTNTLKTRRRDLAQALVNRGVNLDPIGKWSKVGLVIYNSTVPIGATPEYLGGHYILQGASSMLPVAALAPQPNERILDMCAAPGGKASHIAALMKNTGVLFANDVSKERSKAIVGNFHRLGVINSVVTCLDGRQYGKVMKGFDRVLLDAPCTGTGVISKDTGVKTNKDALDVQRCYTLQRDLILEAIDCLNARSPTGGYLVYSTCSILRDLILEAIDCLNARSPTGGYLVYSTCSILPEENEAVVNYALRKRDVKLVPTGLDFGTEGFVNYRQNKFHPSMKLTRRFYPHTHNMDGFFVAKFKKFSNVIPVTVDEPEPFAFGTEEEAEAQQEQGQGQSGQEEENDSGHPDTETSADEGEETGGVSGGDEKKTSGKDGNAQKPSGKIGGPNKKTSGPGKKNSPNQKNKKSSNKIGGNQKGVHVSKKNAKSGGDSKGGNNQGAKQGDGKQGVKQGGGKKGKNIPQKKAGKKNKGPGGKPVDKPKEEIPNEYRLKQAKLAKSLLEGKPGKGKSPVKSGGEKKVVGFQTKKQNKPFKKNKKGKSKE
ncbi:hypothetical protein M8J77_013576 [Diaphorina citri]|nr:hypothetical protein M8J77_013576 [Diaphorina citri]KAI5752074.1 hypothetical protein M8J77_013576 [Diaphorina citri]KAI5752077.1 hypothetical protein M8J77_013576 [Diaphorina citri]